MTVMKATLHGQVNKPAVIFSGTWDPILPEHMKIVRRLIDYAHQNDLNAVLVIFDPAPASFVLKKFNQDAKWITYNEIEVTTQYLLNEGLDGVIHVHFEPEYLDMGVYEFYTTVSAHIEIAEFWFGARQSLGRGPDGSQTEIIKQGKKRGIKLRRLRMVNTDKVGNRVRHFLSHGSPKLASEYAQYPPVRKKPKSDVAEIVLPWEPGSYLALASSNIDENSNMDERKIEIMLEKADDSSAKFVWPDPQIQYLTFVEGPKDIMSMSLATD